MSKFGKIILSPAVYSPLDHYDSGDRIEIMLNDEDLKGDWRVGYACPLARAMKRAFPEASHVCVGVRVVWLFEEFGGKIKRSLQVENSFTKWRCNKVRFIHTIRKLLRFIPEPKLKLVFTD